MSRMFRIHDQVAPGDNIQVSNYPTIKVAPESIQRWKTNTIQYLKLQKNSRNHKIQTRKIADTYNPEYKQTIDHLMTAIDPAKM